MNLCSKCYRDYRLKENQSSSAKEAVKKSFNSKPLVEEIETEEEQKEEKPVAVASNRCACCNKKVGFLGFLCRCGATFCGSHRYPEQHKCSFDHKTAGKEAIAKANPLVVADKLERI